MQGGNRMAAYDYADFSTARRTGENNVPVSNRRNRFFSTGSEWFFCTREGVTQGPFDSRLHAYEANQKYIRECMSLQQ